MAHDALGRVTQAIDKEFVFDPLGRLVLVKAAGVVVESYHYDGDGQLGQLVQGLAGGLGSIAR